MPAKVVFCNSKPVLRGKQKVQTKPSCEPRYMVDTKLRSIFCEIQLLLPVGCDYCDYHNFFRNIFCITGIVRKAESPNQTIM
jgi:hypothetical protein